MRFFFFFWARGEADRPSSPLLFPSGSPAGPCYLPPRAPASVLSAARVAGCGRLALTVGVHYFGRACAACPRLAAAAAAHPATAPFVPPPPSLAAARASGSARPLGRPLGAALARRGALAPGAWPAGVLAVCVWLGAKVVGDRRRAGGLAAMLDALCGRGARAGDGVAAEADVLAALEWRLGPFFVD